MLEEMSDLHLYDFGIFIELHLMKKKKRFRKQYTTALQAGLIDLTDAIDIREIKNINLANQLLKIRKS